MNKINITDKSALSRRHFRLCGVNCNLRSKVISSGALFIGQQNSAELF